MVICWYPHKEEMYLCMYIHTYISDRAKQIAINTVEIKMVIIHLYGTIAVQMLQKIQSGVWVNLTLTKIKMFWKRISWLRV